MDQANWVNITPRPTASVAATVPTSEAAYSPATMLTHHANNRDRQGSARDGFKVDGTEADRVRAYPRTGSLKWMTYLRDWQ
jgi:hypothetical protein